MSKSRAKVVSNSRTIGITGAGGFIGAYLSDTLEFDGYVVRRFSRTHDLSKHEPNLICKNLNHETNWISELSGIDCLIHCGARAHILCEKSDDPLMEYRNVNVLGTKRLAEQAELAGVRRFIFLSSIGVLGTNTNGRGPFTHLDKFDPKEPYGQSKAEAEDVLMELAQKTRMEIVIIRPPLVYGPNVRANFYRLMQLVSKGLIIPFGMLAAKRSLVSLDNLIDLITLTIDHDEAANKTFLVSDGSDISIRDLVMGLGVAMKIPIRLISIPPFLIKIAGVMFGKTREVNRLLDELCVDISFTYKTLGWSPKISVEEGLRRSVEGVNVEKK